MSESPRELEGFDVLITELYLVTDPVLLSCKFIFLQISSPGMVVWSLLCNIA